jgi:hypothetical protein
MAKTATKARPKTKAKAKSGSSKSTASKTKATATAKTRKATTKAKPKSKAKVKPDADESIEVLNETGNRKSGERRENQKAAADDRRKSVRRRRQIDPTTCERDYTEQEIQFMHAMDEYKQLSGRMFPTCSEILEVLKKLGYRQIADVQAVYDPNAESGVGSDQADEEDGDDFESCV